MKINTWKYLIHIIYTRQQSCIWFLKTKDRDWIFSLYMIIDSFMRHERDSESYFSRDGKFEKFERADGSLRGYKRDCTSLANR